MPEPTPAGSSELDALLAAISDAIEALVAWDIADFQSAVERQHAICERLARKTPGQCPADATTTRKVQELNHVYDRLLRHSIHWTRTIHAMLQTTGHADSRRVPVHFRG